MSPLIRSQPLRRATVVLLTATVGVLASYSVLVLWYLRPVDAPIELPGSLLLIFLYFLVVGVPGILIAWLMTGRSTLRRVVVGLSVLGLLVTLKTLEMSYADSFRMRTPSGDNFLLRDGWLSFTKHGPAPPPRGFGTFALRPVIWSLRVPAVFAPVLFMIIPGVELRHWMRRRRRRRRGLCEDCGYDLRGAMRTCSECGTRVGRCPECGIVVTQAGEFHAAAPG